MFRRRLHREMLQCSLPEVIRISFAVGRPVKNFLSDLFHPGLCDGRGEAGYRLVEGFGHCGNRFLSK
ncbi:hypothetical protein SAMN05444321_0116 [Bradyrhizobium lablabi]|nr:hypothetical protein SAMN05444321_0116 [Bradyrhizobium lablabi]